MVFHNKFEDRYTFCDTPNWFELKSKLYADMSKWEPHTPDEVFFHFKAPNAGWMDFEVFINGKKKHECYFSAAFDPFYDLKVWMEDIVNDCKMCSTLPIEKEGRTLIFHYENIKLCDVSVRRRFVHEDRENDKWELTNANSHPTIGLFCLYDSNCDTLPVVCLCSAKQLVSCLYNALLEYATGRHSDKISKQWYYTKYMSDKWNFYNIIKSPLIEWFIYSDNGYRHCRPKFSTPPTIKETIHMWAEWGGGLFWQGKCCGNVNGFFIETGSKRIDLTDMSELKEWYDEFDNHAPEDNWPEEEYSKWFERGWSLAKLVRKRLPDNVDLFYQWQRIMVPSSMEIHNEIPLIVPNENMNL